jgi:flagellin
MSALNIAEGGTQGIQDMLGRMSELSVQAANDTLTDTERQALNEEFQQLKQEVDRQAMSTNFNGQNLLNAGSPLSDGTGNIQVGPESSDGERTAYVNLDTAALGLKDLDISSANAARAAIDATQSANKQINETRVTVGAQYNRLEHTYQNNANQDINTTAALATAESLDFAQALMEQATQSVLAESAIRAQANFQDISRSSMLGLLAP